MRATLVKRLNLARAFRALRVQKGRLR
jgi:hypothetical protein